MLKRTRSRNWVLFSNPSNSYFHFLLHTFGATVSLFTPHHFSFILFFCSYFHLILCHLFFNTYLPFASCDKIPVSVIAFSLLTCNFYTYPSRPWWQHVMRKFRVNYWVFIVGSKLRGVDSFSWAIGSFQVVSCTLHFTKHNFSLCSLSSGVFFPQ